MNARLKVDRDSGRSANDSVSGDFRSINVGEFFMRIVRFLPNHQEIISIRSNARPLLIQRVGGNGNSVRAGHDAVAANQRAINLGIA